MTGSKFIIGHGSNAEVVEPASTIRALLTRVAELEAQEVRLRELVEFVRDLNPRVSYPPEDIDDEPHVVIPNSTWDAIVDDAAALANKETDDV